jgi:pyruvate/2-oxoglutarate/acetoin dehydrogenase E1 component
VDCRSLVPLDIDTISASVKKTGQAAVITQAPYTGGFASHISHEIGRTSFEHLKKPVQIIAGYDVPPPMSFPLEVENMPGPERISREIRNLFK